MTKRGSARKTRAEEKKPGERRGKARKSEPVRGCQSVEAQGKPAQRRKNQEKEEKKRAGARVIKRGSAGRTRVNVRNGDDAQRKHRK